MFSITDAGLLLILLSIIGLVWSYRYKRRPDTSLYSGCEMPPRPNPVGDPDALAAWDKETDEKQFNRKRRHK